MDKNRSNVDGIDEYWCMNTDEMDKSWSTRQPHLPQLFQVYFYWLKGTGISHFLNSVGFPELHGSWYSATPCSMDDGNGGKKKRASMSSWLYFGKCIFEQIDSTPLSDRGWGKTFHLSAKVFSSKWGSEEALNQFSFGMPIAAQIDLFDGGLLKSWFLW